MKRIFIVQPVADKNEMQITMDRDGAEEFLSGLFGADGEVINPLVLEPGAAPKTPLAKLGADVELMSSADLVYFCAGWKKDRRAKIIHECATKYGLCVMYEPG